MPAAFDFVFALIYGNAPPGLKTVKSVFHSDHPMEPYDKDAASSEQEALKKNGIVLTREPKHHLKIGGLSACSLSSSNADLV
jgi:hypothetical protein